MVSCNVPVVPAALWVVASGADWAACDVAGCASKAVPARLIPSSSTVFFIQVPRIFFSPLRVAELNFVSGFRPRTHTKPQCPPVVSPCFPRKLSSSLESFRTAPILAQETGCAILRMPPRRDGGTGRRSGLKIRRGQPHGGSIPPPGTKLLETRDKQGIFEHESAVVRLLLGNPVMAGPDYFADESPRTSHRVLAVRPCANWSQCPRPAPA